VTDAELRDHSMKMWAIGLDPTKFIAAQSQNTVMDAYEQKQDLSEDDHRTLFAAQGKVAPAKSAFTTEHAQNVFKETATGLYADLRRVLGRDPTQAEYMEAKKAGASRVHVDMGRSYKSTLGKQGAEKVAGHWSDTQAAHGMIEAARAARSILDGGLDTGTLAPAKAKVSALAQSAGIDPALLGLDQAGDAQAFQGLVMKNLLNELAMQKGPQTEGDAERALKTWAQLGTTPEANRWILSYAEAVANRKIEMGEFMGERTAFHNGDYGKAMADWNRYISTRPLTAISPTSSLPVTYYEAKAAAQANGVSPEQFETMWGQMAGGQ